MYSLNSQLRIQLRKLINSAVNIKPVYSCEAPSRRIEGQFGGEIMKEAFSEINIYIQYTQAVMIYEILKDIISQCYVLCKHINLTIPIGMRCFLFNDINNGIRLINKYAFLRQKDEKETFLKEVREFRVGEDIRTLNRLSNSTNFVDKNALCIFITDNLGCELSEILKRKNRSISKQSIWILVESEHIDARKGIPVKL